MTNFIYDDTGLPIDKSNLAPLPAGADPKKWIVATEWIQAMQALLDTKNFARGARWLGLSPQSADPVPAGIAKYVWLRDDGSVMKTIDGTATALGGGGGGGDVFVFHPGGTAGGNVYVTWAAVITAISAVKGPVTIAFDDTDQAIEIPAGTYTGYSDMTWVGARNRQNNLTQIGIDDGATFDPMPAELSHCVVKYLGATPDSSPFYFNANGLRLYLTDSAQIWQEGGEPLIGVGGGTSGRIIVGNGVQIRRVAGPVIELDNGGDSLEIFFDGARNTLEVDSLAGAEGTTFDITTSASSSDGIETRHADVLGTLNQFTQQYPRVPFPGSPPSVISSPDNVPIGYLSRWDASSNGGPMDVTLLGAAVANQGGVCVIKNYGAVNDLHVVPAATQTIDGSTAFYRLTPGRSATFVSDGVSDWTCLADASGKRSIVLDQTPDALDPNKIYHYTAGGAVPVNLPTAASCGGSTIVIKNTTVSTSAITITPNGADTIDGGATLVINTAHGSYTLESDGVSRWSVIAKV